MNKRQDWNMSMLASDERRDKWRGPALAGAIAGLHVVAITGFLMIQGCGTKQPAVEQPPAPVMPPRADTGAPALVMPRPAFQPPIGVEPAPATLEGAGVQTHTVASGESLSRIAARYGVSVREIQELNGIKDPNKVRIGQKLKLPPYAEPAPAAAKPAAKKETKPAKPAVAGAGEYVVQAGDSLSRIAARHGTTVAALKQANNLQSDMIRSGQKLKIPAGATKPAAARATAPAPAPAPAPSSAVEPAPDPAAAAAPVPAAAPSPAPIAPLDASLIPFEYTVRPNETIDDIARNFAVTRSEILALNGLAEGAAVRAGQKIKIPMAAP